MTSLLEWIDIIANVKPKSLIMNQSQDIEVVIYTDGYFPDQRKEETEEPRIGGVAFAKGRRNPVAFSAEVPQEVMDAWIPRKTQIVMVEAIALPPVPALEPPQRLYIKGAPFGSYKSSVGRVTSSG